SCLAPASTLHAPPFSTHLARAMAAAVSTVRKPARDQRPRLFLPDQSARFLTRGLAERCRRFSLKGPTLPTDPMALTSIPDTHLGWIPSPLIHCVTTRPGVSVSIFCNLAWNWSWPNRTSWVLRMV